jgi:hypothetical protein
MRREQNTRVRVTPDFQSVIHFSLIGVLVMTLAAC